MSRVGTQSGSSPTVAPTGALQRQLRDFAIVATVAIIVATCAFVAVRNTELATRQIDLAQRTAEALATSRAPLPSVHGAIIGPAIPSKKHPYLRRRMILDLTGWRELGGAPVRPPDTKTGGAGDGRTADTKTGGAGDGRTADAKPGDGRAADAKPGDDSANAKIGDGRAADAKPGDDSANAKIGDGRAADAVRLADDKLFYDAATRFDRTGPFAELMPDGSGRAIAAIPLPEDLEGGYGGENGYGLGKGDTWTTGRSGGVSIAITEPAAPAPYPFLVMIGVLGLGLAFAAAGALVGGRAARVGMFGSIAALAVPTILWGAPIATAIILLLAAAVTFAQHRHITDRFSTGLLRNRTALSFLAPAAISMLVLVAAPFVIGLILGFYDHHQGTWTFVGFSNFKEILSGGDRPLNDPLNFWFTLGVTVLWTVMNITLHVTIGVALALLLSRKWIRARGIWRMLLILPWAIPNYITALIWGGMFDGQYGAINSLLHHAGLNHQDWFTQWATSFSANVITNTWLGFPFMMVVALGALETIPKELYEAASVDGASKWQRFRHITLPHLRPALGPAVALSSIWTFNMFNVIFLVSRGRPGGSTNILVTEAYRWAFERGERYGMAAAYATIIFLVLLLWTVFGTRIVRSKEADS
ncbi:MAG TPA: sugar ABC transporter permease [Kofleriaceae bacterium]|nr:sugar ABC transporter permease [Kofleriaceae bacterium]